MTATMKTAVVDQQKLTLDRTLPDQVPVGRMFVDESYGRSIKSTHLRKIVREFDPNGLGVILLSLRDDGRFAILDGQHRWEAAKLHGHPSMYARVYVDLNVDEEAHLYNLFAHHLSQKPIDKFRAGLVEGNPTYRAIALSVERLGMKVSNGGDDDGTVRSVAIMQRVYERYGQEMLDIVLKTLYAAYGRKANAYQSAMLWGLAQFTLRYIEHADWVRVVARMKAEGVLGITQRAKMLKTAMSAGRGDASVGQVIVGLYNQRSQTPLSEWWEMHGDRVTREQLPTVIDPKIRLRMREAWRKGGVPNA